MLYSSLHLLFLQSSFFHADPMLLLFFCYSYTIPFFMLVLLRYSIPLPFLHGNPILSLLVLSYLSLSYAIADVLILADVFEAFREMGMMNFGLDPAHYVSAPQFAWDSMLKSTEAKVDLISDLSMYEMISSGIRGGICMISKRHAKANHEQMGELYNPDLPKKTITYFDANNLYGYAMSQPLPDKDFQWVPPERHPTVQEIRNLPNYSPYGYVFECDLRYPEKLHELHNEYPLAPERVNIETDMLSEKQLQIRLNYNISHAHTTKLVPHLGDRIHYVLHSAALKFYLVQGMELVRIHRCISFHQSPWMKVYVDRCSALRAAATNEFERDFFKIMVNSVYGKTVENQSKRSDIKIVQSRAQCKKLTEKPQCISFRIFSEHLAAVQSKKVSCMITKPFYVGFSVLDISKVWMYRFHYEFVKPNFNDQAHLLFTDTDSLMYEIESGYKDVYECFKSNENKTEPLFDFSTLPTTNAYFSNKNKRVIGKFKDETSGDPIVEFIGLRPKMYSFTTLSMAKGTVKEKHRAKGIQYAAAARLTHAQYLAQLSNPTENRLTNKRIGSLLHHLYTLATEKRALCAFDDKRYLCHDGVNTLAFGHHNLPSFVKVEFDSEHLMNPSANVDAEGLPCE